MISVETKPLYESHLTFEDQKPASSSKERQMMNRNTQLSILFLLCKAANLLDLLVRLEIRFTMKRAKTYATVKGCDIQYAIRTIRWDYVLNGSTCYDTMFFSVVCTLN